jgi:hypothetical protein
MGGFGFDLLNRIEGLLEAIQYDRYTSLKNELVTDVSTLLLAYLSSLETKRQANYYSGGYA